MKMKKIIAAVLASGMILNSVACVPVKESLPEDTIEAYEVAYNAMDIQAMLDCIDEKTVKSLTAGMDVMMGLVGAITEVDLGISASDLLDLAPLVQAMMGDSFAAQMGDIPQVDFQVQETYIKGDRATVYFSEVNSNENMVINMVKNDGKWYMTLSTIMITKDTADRVIIAGEEKKNRKNRFSNEEKDSIFEELRRSLDKDEDWEDKDSEEDEEERDKVSDAISQLLGSDKLKEALTNILEDDD